MLRFAPLLLALAGAPHGWAGGSSQGVIREDSAPAAITHNDPSSADSRKETGDIMVPEVEAQAPKIPRKPDVPPGTPTRILTGKLVRKINSFGPRYPIRLESTSGKRIAYVDMSHLFVNDLRPYLNHEVFIRGEISPIVPGSGELVVLARSIRIAD